MNPQTARWLLEGTNAFIKDSNLTEWQYLSRQYFFNLLRAVFAHIQEIRYFTEAKDLLEAVIRGEITAPSYPNNLRLMVEEAEKARLKQEEIRKKAEEDVRRFLEEQKKAAIRQTVYKAPKEKKEEAPEPEVQKPTPVPKKPPEPIVNEALNQQIKDEVDRLLVQTYADLTLEPSQANELADELSKIISQKIVQQGQIAEIWPEINSAFTKRGLSITEEEKQAFLEGPAAELSKAALIGITVQSEAEPEQLKAPPVIPLAERKPAEAKTEPVSETAKAKEALPVNLTQKLASEEGLAFTPIYTISYPPAAVSFVKKLALTPIVKTLQFLDILAGDELEGNAQKEWRRLLHQGLTSEDLSASIQVYLEEGLPENHPKIKEMARLQIQMREYEQTHHLLSHLLKHYHEYTKVTGRRQIYISETDSYLPKLAKSAGWMRKRSFSLKLRKTLNTFGEALGFYKKDNLSADKSIIQFVLNDRLTSLVTLGRIKSFSSVKVWIAKTAFKAGFAKIGKTALVQGVRKAAAGLLVKAGLAAIPSGVTQVAAVALAAKDVLGFLLKQFKKNPLLMALVGAGLIILPFIMTVLTFLAPVFFVLGAISLGAAFITASKAWLGGLAAQAGSFLTGLGSGLASGIGGFISGLGSISVSAVVPALVIISPIALAGGLTYFTMMNIGGAFLKEPVADFLGRGGAPIITLTTSRYIDVNKKAFYEGREVTNIKNEDLKEDSALTYVITVTAKEKNLDNLNITDDLMVTLKNANAKITQDSSGKPIGPWTQAQLTVGQKWETTFTVKIPKSKFEDTLLTNLVTVKADAFNLDGSTSQETGQTMSTLFIGEPPVTLASVLYWASLITDPQHLGLGSNGLMSRLLQLITNGAYFRRPQDAYVCTYLIVDAYRLAGIPGLNDTMLRVDNMEFFWMSEEARKLGYKYLNYMNDNRVIAQTQPGCVIFQYKAGPRVWTGLEHVSMVKSVTWTNKDAGDGIIETYGTNESGRGATFIIKGFKFANPIYPYITGFGCR